MNTEEQIIEVQDTPMEVIKNYPNMKVSGLYYFDDNWNKVQVANHATIYFSCDMVLGLAYARIESCFRPVYLSDGSRFNNADLCGVSARYKDGAICDYYRG